MTDPQLHHAKWLEIESVVSFWDILITPLFIVQEKKEYFFLIITHIKKEKSSSKTHKDYTVSTCPSATFKLFNTLMHSDHKVKN